MAIGCSGRGRERDKQIKERDNFTHVISPGHNEHPNQSLVSIDNEVATHFLTLVDHSAALYV